MRTADTTHNLCLLGTGTSPTAIAALTSTVNRTTTNLQPLVPIGTQMPQPQFQVRMVQFPQQGGPAQIQQTIVQSPRGATPVQIHTQQAQVVQGLQQVTKWPTRHETITKSSIFVASLVSSLRISINNYVSGALLWNNLRQEMRDANSIEHFK